MVLDTQSQRGLIWPHYKGVHVNSQKSLYCLAARAAETSCFQQQNHITQLGVKAPWSSSARRCGVLLCWVLEEMTEQTKDSETEMQWKLKEKEYRPGGSMHMLVLHTDITVPSAPTHLLLNHQATGGWVAVFLIPNPCTPTKVMQRWLL